MEFYSHVTRDEQGNISRKKPLEDHLREVATQMKRSIGDMPIDAADDMAKAAYLIGISHDFGKFTTYFQKYLLYGSKDGSLHFHGFISAVFAGYVMQKLWHSDNRMRHICLSYPIFSCCITTVTSGTLKTML